MHTSLFGFSLVDVYLAPVIFIFFTFFIFDSCCKFTTVLVAFCLHWLNSFVSVMQLFSDVHAKVFALHDGFCFVPNKNI